MARSQGIDPSVWFFGSVGLFFLVATLLAMNLQRKSQQKSLVSPAKPQQIVEVATLPDGRKLTRYSFWDSGTMYLYMVDGVPVGVK